MQDCFSDLWTLYLTLIGILLSILTLLYSFIIGKKDELKLIAELIKLDGKKHITMKKLIFSFIVVATAILVSCNEEFEEVTTIDIPNYRDGVYSGDNLTFTVDGEPRTVNSVTISSRQVGNDTLYSDNLKKHYLNPIYATNIIIKGFPGKKDRITIPAISSVDKLRGCINIYPEYYDCFGKFTGSPLDRHEEQGLELQLISR